MIARRRPRGPARERRMEEAVMAHAVFLRAANVGGTNVFGRLTSRVR